MNRKETAQLVLRHLFDLETGKPLVLRPARSGVIPRTPPSSPNCFTMRPLRSRRGIKRWSLVFASVINKVGNDQDTCLRGGTAV